jgi:cell division protein FtsI/penicillin-binding protein 2
MIPFALLALGAASLHDQSLTLLLREKTVDPRVSYLFADARTGRLLDSRWDAADAPAPLGSLVKPFTALAYGEAHHFEYPEVVCRGARDGCWLERGHGRIGLAEAVAHSCNAYFRVLAQRVDPDAIAILAQRMGLEPPPTPSPDALVGLGGLWQVSPTAMLRGYRLLLADPNAAEISRGMALSVRHGTGRGAHAGLVKTGTAPCIHPRRATGDGYAIAFFPAGSPRYALLVRVHGVPGAEAAVELGRMLRLLGQGR